MIDNLLKQYMSHFVGYGNLGGDYWMIGMEEGGGDTAEEIERRVAIWQEIGQNQLEDLKHYMVWTDPGEGTVWMRACFQSPE